MSERDKQFFDPKHTPVQVSLEALAGVTFAATKASEGKGYAVWAYDPRNRISTPCVSVSSDLAGLLAGLAVFMVDTCEDDPRIAEVLTRALDVAAIQRLEFKAKALHEGGYLTHDPTEKNVQRSDSQQDAFYCGRLLPDRERAKACAAEARVRRAALAEKGQA